jgi:hypothetical protein
MGSQSLSISNPQLWGTYAFVHPTHQSITLAPEPFLRNNKLRGVAVAFLARKSFTQTEAATNLAIDPALSLEWSDMPKLSWSPGTPSTKARSQEDEAVWLACRLEQVVSRAFLTGFIRLPPFALMMHMMITQ